MRKPIVVGVDGSQVARSAISWAADVALVRETPLLLVHAAPPGAATGDADGVVREAVAIAAEAGADSAQFRVVPGTPVEALLAVARDAAMLVLGSRGSGAGTGLMPGFTALSLVRAASCPVAVIPDRGSRHVPSARGPVVVGFVAEAGGTAAVDVAAEMAAAWGVRLRVVHAAGGDRRGSGAERRVRRLLEDLSADLTGRFPGLVVERRIASDTPVRSLLAEASTAAAVVVGQRAHAVPNGGVGSTSRNVIQLGTCPVVVAPVLAAVP